MSGASASSARLLSSVQIIALVAAISAILGWLVWQQHERLRQPQAATLFEATSAGSAPDNLIQGTAVWSFAAASADGPALRVHLDLPQRRTSFDLSIHRNRDDSVPASHLIVIEAHTPADFPGAGVAEVPQFAVSASADPAVSGAALDGQAVEVADGLFWIGLADEPSAITRNLQLLRRGSFAQLSLVYRTGQTATLVFGKGPQGDDAVRQVLLAWGRKL